MIGPFPTEEEALAEAKRQAAEGLLIEFDGQNCNDYLDDEADECDGWDGVDNRCECGNRRVYWEVENYGATDGEQRWFAIARAY